MSEKLEFPLKLDGLFQPYRYKILYGGRGGAKSWNVARALLILGSKRPLRVLCARELQNSIADSVHKLLSDQIDLMFDGADAPAAELRHFYTIEKSKILGANGTEFSFEGIKHNVQKIKSYEGIDVCWVEEAQAVSEFSWNVLVPTIRKNGSEIWVTFNPDLEDDATYKRFITNPQPDSLVVKINWKDNPWFPAELLREMEHMKESDFDSYMNVYEGHCRQVLEGAVYAQEMRDATMDNRIGKVPYDRTVGVHTFWDLGWGDQTTIWFVQRIGMEFHLVDFYSNRLKPLDHYVEVLEQRRYVYSIWWLPHDAKAKSLQTGRTVEELLRQKGKTVKIVPSVSLIDGINAARTLFPNCWFDANRCAEGLKALRHYKFDIDRETRQLSKKPLHDDSSHAADAFRYFAVGFREPKKRKLIERIVGKGGFSVSQEWMG